MKIEDISAFHRREAIILAGPEGQPTYRSQVHDNMAEALEKHHKDLAGLVEEWRDESGRPFVEPEAIHAWNQCADELESLINPKD